MSRIVGSYRYRNPGGRNVIWITDIVGASDVSAGSRVAGWAGETDGLAGATFKENIIGNNDCSPASRLEHRADVLDEVELLV